MVEQRTVTGGKNGVYLPEAVVTRNRIASSIFERHRSRRRRTAAVSINILKVVGGALLALGMEGAFHYFRRKREDPTGTAITEWLDFFTNRELTIPYVSALLGFFASIVFGAALLWLDVPLVFKWSEFDQAFHYDYSAHSTFFAVVSVLAIGWLIVADGLSAEWHHPFLPEELSRLAGGLIRIALIIYWLVLVVDAALSATRDWELVIGVLLLLLALNWLVSGWIGSLAFWERHEVHRVTAHEYPLSYGCIVLILTVVGAVCLRGKPYGNGKDSRPLGAPATAVVAPPR